MSKESYQHLKAKYYPETAGEGLPPVRRFITGHDAEGNATVERHDGGQWTHYDNKSMAFNVMYTTSQTPPDLNSNMDIQLHDRLIEDGMLGLVNANGSVLRIVDFGPGVKGRMHRTQSIDYGIVLEGEIDMVLDKGETHRLKRGNVAIQRATIHQWVNPTDQWTRVAFVLLDCVKVTAGGKALGEDLGGPARWAPSGNDR